MTRGLVIGKFYPPHKGHHYLIDRAQAGCDELMVLVLWAGQETIFHKDRVRWLKEVHPKALVVSAQDEHPIDYSDEGWQKHINIISDVLMDWGHKPDMVFSSESYGDELAERLSDAIGYTVIHNMVDEARSAYNISGTEMRKDIRAHWDMLSAPARADLAYKVVVCGGESTGTTTLAKQLAEHYNTTCVPEYGRHFDWAVGKNHTWATADFKHIATQQVDWIKFFGRYSENGILICDTYAYATAMFHEIYLGHQEYDILDYAHMNHGPLYLITDHEGVKFEDDGTRFNSGKRAWATSWFDEFLANPHVLVSGDRPTRLKTAINEIEANASDYMTFGEPIGEVVIK